ncbi:hypothetical protein BRETT_001175 [Brettanomyces bruxellensis]|uniref:protein-tyrosine-phosphatase n=1 Tax=Dekkera bruxellensis TaxID=5007 RepID=A0A871REK5_DEKBR|nr:uncharacterized protein BRETT_001175 [Brettanomyces bruxellensis]QOU21452.1 hypothetical protein BRETT_001175 [Brettanomyces bruxellensis]
MSSPSVANSPQCPFPQNHTSNPSVDYFSSVASRKGISDNTISKISTEHKPHILSSTPKECRFDPLPRVSKHQKPGIHLKLPSLMLKPQQISFSKHVKNTSEGSSFASDSDSATLVDNTALNFNPSVSMRSQGDNRSISTLFSDSDESVPDKKVIGSPLHDECFMSAPNDNISEVNTLKGLCAPSYPENSQAFGHRVIKSEPFSTNDGSNRTPSTKANMLHTPCSATEPKFNFQRPVFGFSTYHRQNSSSGSIHSFSSSISPINSHFGKLDNQNNMRSFGASGFQNFVSSSESLTGRTSRFKNRKNPLPEGCSLLSRRKYAEMVEHLSKHNHEGLLVIDVRPFQEYCKAHISGAINICLPSTLLRRATFTLEKCVQTLAVIERKTFSSYLTNSNTELPPCVLLYDDFSSTADDVSSSVNHLSLKFVNCTKWKSSIFVLEGSLSQMGDDFPELICSGSLPSTRQPVKINKDVHYENSPAKNKSNKIANLGSDDNVQSDLSSSSSAESGSSSYSNPSFVASYNGLSDDGLGLSHFSLPSTAHDPFYRMRHQEEDLDFDPDRSLHLSTNIPDGEKKVLPKWLLDIFGPDLGATKLSRKFNNLQIEERHRLNEAMTRGMHKNSKSVSDAEIPMVTAGVELGRKNRYKDIFPYEHARVKIQKYNGRENDLDEESSYINASYLHYPSSEFQYIATQGPLKETIGDFWRVICDHNVPLVFSLTAERENEVEKCAPYWDEGIYTSNGILVEVHLLEVDNDFALLGSESGDLVARRLQITIGSKPAHEVLQIHLLSWEDYGGRINSDELLSLVSLKRYLQAETDTEKSPVVVHCSAGCGRTGCFCTIDTCVDLFLSEKDKCLESANNEKDLVYDIISKFRCQRVSMVQNLRQYILIYDTILTFKKNQMTRLNKGSQKGALTMFKWDKRGEDYGILNNFIHSYNKRMKKNNS